MDHHQRLTKQPPNTAAINFHSYQENDSDLARHPSASPSSAAGSNRDHIDSRTYSSHTSSTSSVEPSPKLAASKSGAQAQAEPYQNHHRFSLRRSLNGGRTSDELVGASSDGSGSTIDSTKASGYQNSLRRPAPPPLSHTSPDPRMISPQLRQSASFSTVDRSSNITPPRSDTSLTASKRYSDEGRTAPWRKKGGGFSSFMNSVLGSPRTVKISAPGNPVHVTHVGFDNETGQFTVGHRLSHRSPSCSSAPGNSLVRPPFSHRTHADIPRVSQKNGSGSCRRMVLGRTNNDRTPRQFTTL